MLNNFFQYVYATSFLTSRESIDHISTLARLLGRLKMEGGGIEEREWVMAGAINLGAMLGTSLLQCFCMCSRIPCGKPRHSRDRL
jgi:hypothetical protein